MISLREINEDNFNECINLKVKDEQNNFVARNIYSLAQAWLYRTSRPFAIYCDDNMVGFIMLEYDEVEKECGIWRFMIDERYQNKGYGKAAMECILKYIRSNPIFEVIHLSYEPENTIAEKLYRSFGFMPSGEIEDGEVVMILKLN